MNTPATYAPVLLALAVLFGCEQKQSSQDLKEKTAQTTAEVKRDAKAVAAGIREGWNRDKKLNLNTATRNDLESLPGVSSAEADRVVAGRPYERPDDLVKRRIMSQAEFDKISDRVTAK